ncbi:MAG TPA: hypothetical protein EYN17_04660, partial [Candidatus Poseidoniales archaeon]|nr:hypothetical protein [Candidatus Poseidoniales archaeon]
MASVMLLSTLLSASSISAINETVEFSTDGDILLLDGASNAIISLSMDNPQTENFDESDEIRDITFLRHRLPNKEATSITHDNTDLYIGWNDGLVEHYAKQDGMPPFVHWVKTGDRVFAPPAISVQLTDQGQLSWVTLDDNKIRIIGKSDFDLSFPQIIEKTIVGAENGISSFTLLDGQLMALDSSGNSIMETTSTQEPDSLAVISKMWAREDLRSVKAVSSIRNGLGTDGSGSSQLLVVESGGLRLLEMAPSIDRTHILQTTPSADIILPWAGSAVSDETIQSRTVLKFANNDEQSKRRSFPLQVTFGNTPPFTHTVNGTTVQGGKITLSIAGVEKTLSWQDVSNNTMIWQPDNSAQTNRFSRTHVPDTIEVKIVDWTPKNVNFSGGIRIVGDTTDNSTGGVLAQNGIRFANDLGGIATSPFNNGTASIYGNKVLDDIDNSYKVSWIDNFKSSRGVKKGTWETNNGGLIQGVEERNWFERDWNLNDVSVNNPPGGFTHAEFILHGARVDLVDATPMQSVIEPTRYTQDKNMWWNVEVNHEKSSVGIIEAGHPETIPVALEVRGVNCQRFGVLDPGYGINDMTPIGVQNFGDTSGRELAPNVERWHECPYEYRIEMTWAKSEIYNSGARVYTGGVSKAAMLGVKVYTLEFDVPLDSSGSGSAVLPFDKNKVQTHLDMWVRPAEPNDDNYLTDDDGTGMVKWKVIVDPDNTVNETTAQRADNRESAEEETIYFDDDSYDVMVVRTKLVYKECANWNFWNNCVSFYSEGDKPGNFLEAPSAEWANLQIDYSSPKMQEMFPIPEGRLNMYLYDNVLEITTTQQPTRFHLNGWGNKLQRTASFLNVITEGIRLGEAQDNPPDRVLMLYDHDAAAVDNDPSNQMFGWMAFGGIAPCSSAALISDFYENSGNYNVMGGNPIHELSHTMLAGHDNFGLMDSTLNNCGLESAYRPGEGASGFMPSGIPIMDQTDSPHYVSIPMTESWVEGASHMRYSHDGTKLDTDGDGTLDTLEDENGGRVPLSDFYYKNQWIQNVDYELIQDQYSYNSEESFLLKWGELALTDEIQGLALTGILVFDLIMTGLIALIIAGFSSANPVGWVLSALLAIVLIIVIGMVNSLIDSALSTSSTAEEIETARSVTSISQYLDFELTTNDWNDHLSMPIITALNNNIRMNNLSTTESNLSIVIRDYQGGIVSETPLETYTALSGLGDGSETHHGIIPWDSDAASYEVVKDGVVIDSGSLVAPDAST